MSQANQKNDFSNLTVGVLALQGDFERHEHQLVLVGARSILVRKSGELDALDALIIPGGESTTMHYLIERFDMRQPLLDFAAVKPIWGTCAGMIMLGSKIEDNQSGVIPLGLLDYAVRRNGYGRQVFSFEEQIPAELDNNKVDLAASFIRAPRITRLGNSIEVLATYKGDPVLVQKGRFMASSFHLELNDNTRLLEYFLAHFAVAIG